MSEPGGRLYLCATPIGNLEDITLRALRILREVDLIAAEDTRRTLKLLSSYDIHTPLTSYHEHNMRKKGEEILALLAAGKQVALVSDAGLPGISDPGTLLVSQAIERAIAVEAIPGPSAFVTALVVSGLPSDSFAFEGFLHPAGKLRQKKLAGLRKEPRTMIFYEAPHRIIATLSDMLGAFGDRPAAVARELTKRHEEVARGVLSELLHYFQTKEPRGEFTIVVGGCLPECDEAEGTGKVDLTPAEYVAVLESRGIERREAIRETAARLGLPRRAVYNEFVAKEKERLE